MLVMALMVVASASHLSAQSFAGSNTGAIADGSGVNTCGAARNINFNVTGLSPIISSISVNFTGTHTYVGDLQVALVAPDSTSHTLFSYVGRTPPVEGGYGDSSNLNGTYTFADTGTLNIWQQAAGLGDGGTIPAGNYRT